MELDRIDRSILRTLQKKAGISNIDLAKEVGLSPSPCLRRVKRLEEAGVIRERVTLLDPAAVGLPVSVFIRVQLERQVEAALETFEEAIKQRPEIVECYLVTGDNDYQLRAVIPDLESYQRLLMDHLTRIPGVASIRSQFALRQVKFDTALPISEP